MAIVSTIIELHGRTFTKHESDAGKYIRQIETGKEYLSAMDNSPCKYTYEETDKLIKNISETSQRFEKTVFRTIEDDLRQQEEEKDKYEI